MKSKKDTFAGMIALACLIALSIYTLAIMAQSRIKRTDLQRHDLSVPGREVLQVRVDIDAGVTLPMHSHHGEEVVYVIEGTWEFQLEGKGVQTLNTGDVAFVPAGAKHQAKNVGSGKGAVLATYIVEKGKPLVIPAQRP